MNRHLYLKSNGDFGEKTTQSYGSDSLRHKKNILLLLDILVYHNIPLSLVDGKRFYNFVTFLDPKFNVISRRTLERHLKDYVENEVYPLTDFNINNDCYI